jgi:plasmid maintenance system antidote protein VapI
MKRIEDIKVKRHPLHPLVKYFGIDLAAVAQFCGVSYTHMSYLINGKGKPSRKTARKMDKLVKRLKAKMREEVRDDTAS